MSKQLFIVGAGRSGTTLLQSILNAHTQISFAPESHFLRNYIFPQLKGKSITESPDFDWLIDTLNSDEDFKRLEIDPKEIEHESIDFSSKTFFIDVFNEVMRLYLAKSDKIHFGDKDPMNLNHIAQLKEAYPDAHVIHIIRDPRDVVMSRMKTEWGKKHPFFAHVFDYAHHVSKGLKNGPKYFGDKYHEIRYEDLLVSPESALKKLCAELGVEFEDNMLSYHEKDSNLVKENEKSWKGNVDKPIMSDNFDKWKKEMKQAEVMLVETVCGAVIDKMNYSKSGYSSVFFFLFLSIPYQVMYYLFSLRKTSIEK